MNAKTDNTDYAELELLIPDYLNGVATPEQRVEIEQAVRESFRFRQAVESDRALLANVRDQKLGTNASPSFNDISAKIQRRSPWMFPGLGWTSAAALALVLMVGIGTWTGEQVAFDDFETLSSEPVGYDNATLRVIGASGVSADELRLTLRSYSLTVEKEHPSLGVFDVSTSDITKLAAIAEDLGNDPMFRSVRFLTQDDE